MSSEEINKLLKNVPNPISHIERDLGMPATILQKSLKGKRRLPKKWAIALRNYVETKQYLLSAVISNITPSKKEIIEIVVNDLTKPTSVVKPKEQPKSNFTIDNNPKHPLWKEGDPKEGTMAFFLKYDCNTYNELQNKK
jgi:hypothetical protein